jgi:predicted metal-dependent phosphotriesterase family hydrolase
MSLTRTVLGDIAPADLGVTNYHEHLFHSSPLLPGEDLDDEQASTREALRMRDSGFTSMVDATPLGLGRRPDALARISTTTGVNIIAATGAHRDEHYVSGHWIREMNETALAERFTAEISAGMDDTSVRAGIVKIGIGYWRISPFERTVIAAAASAHRASSAPVMIHLEHASAGFEVLELLRLSGVPADAVVLAHVDRNPDPVLHADLAATGAYLGYDGWARFTEWPESTLIDCAARAIERGAGDRIVVGGDVARRSRYIEYGGLPGLEYLGLRVLPRLEAALGSEASRQLTTHNPARLFSRFSE